MSLYLVAFYLLDSPLALTLPSPSPSLSLFLCLYIYSCLTSARSTPVGYNISSGLAAPSYCFPLLRRSPRTPPLATPFEPYPRLSFSARVLSYNLITRKAARPAASKRYILDFPSLETSCAGKLYPEEGWRGKRGGARWGRIDFHMML